tara:strand:- start:210 stop:458 length:249 start_codon:yes stop_codon:yes gene_type:complete
MKSEKCNDVACKAYKEYANWIETVESISKLQLPDTVRKIKSVAAKNGTRVNDMLKHKRCHQPNNEEFKRHVRWGKPKGKIND